MSGFRYHYPVTHNIECHYRLPFLAHTRYWKDGALYAAIAEAI